jgi:hypothetical protein
MLSPLLFSVSSFLLRREWAAAGHLKWWCAATVNLSLLYFLVFLLHSLLLLISFFFLISFSTCSFSLFSQIQANNKCIVIPRSSKITREPPFILIPIWWLRWLCTAAISCWRPWDCLRLRVRLRLRQFPAGLAVFGLVQFDVSATALFM